MTIYKRGREMDGNISDSRQKVRDRYRSYIRQKFFSHHFSNNTMEDGSDDKTSEKSANIPDVSHPPCDVLESDYVYEALAHSRRRYLCYTLLEETEWTVTDRDQQRYS